MAHYKPKHARPRVNWEAVKNTLLTAMVVEGSMFILFIVWLIS